MRFAVMGTGGAGGYFGARLAMAGHDVSFIARGAHLAAIRDVGLRVDSVLGDVVVAPAHATDDPRELPVVDYVLLGVKAWQVEDAARAIAPIVGPRTAVLPLQNGIEAPEQISDALDRDHALGGTCRILSSIVAPGHIRHVGAEPVLEIGELDGRPSARVEGLLRALSEARGVTATIVPDIRVAMWQKFLFIASWGALGAVTRAPLGVLRTQRETRSMLEAAMREIERIARALSIRMPEAVVPSTLAFVDSLPAPATASLQRDIAAGRPSEVESLCGAVTRYGIRTGVRTPTNTFLYHALLPLERRARGQLEF